MASDFQLIGTENPAEWMVALTIPDRIINDKLAMLPNGMLLEPYTPYNKFTWGGSLPRVQEFGLYRYMTNRKNAPDTTTFYFAKPRTELEKNTPYKVEWSTHQYVWPPVLLDLYFIKSSFPQNTYNGTTTESAIRYFQRHKYVPSTPANSVVKIEKFLSDTTWTYSQLNHDQPVTAEIDGTFLGLQVNFPKCLHRRVVLKELVPGAQIIYGSGMDGSDRNGTPRQQVFPATNFVDWDSFIFADDAPENQYKMFDRQRVTIYPPSRTEPIQNQG